MRAHVSLLVFLLLVIPLTQIGCSKDGSADRSGSSAPSTDRPSGGDKSSGDKSSGDKSSKSAGSSQGRPSGASRGGGFGGFGGGESQPAVPVETKAVERRPISSFLETNGTLEAENDVELRARAGGPIVELLVEEGMQVAQGRLLARIDPAENRARMEIARVERNEAKMAYDRSQTLHESELLSQEAYDAARARYESAEAQLTGEQLLLSYTEIRAPFAGLIAERHIKLAQTVNVGDALFRISEFNSLLCPIQVPERELPRIRQGQQAWITVEAWLDTRFSAKVLRISPVVDFDTGTVKVTLEVSTEGKLRPGMFANVFLETERRDAALVIPKAALSLESIGDTVYVASGGTAERREVELGFREGDFVEVTSGLAEGEPVVVIGQDGLSDGTPIQVLSGAGAPPAAPSSGGEAPEATPGFGDGPPDLSKMTPEQIEGIKKRMRERGLTDEQIEQRLKMMRQRAEG